MEKRLRNVHNAHFKCRDGAHGNHGDQDTRKRSSGHQLGGNSKQRRSRSKLAHKQAGRHLLQQKSYFDLVSNMETPGPAREPLPITALSLSANKSCRSPHV
ncbi:MAG: hypothetical protein AB7F96_11600 [Beijerinckiaceae bacterium]